MGNDMRKVSPLYYLDKKVIIWRQDGHILERRADAVHTEVVPSNNRIALIDSCRRRCGSITDADRFEPVIDHPCKDIREDKTCSGKDHKSNYGCENDAFHVSPFVVV
jgi:hypothetical protein